VSLGINVHPVKLMARSSVQCHLLHAFTRNNAYNGNRVNVCSHAYVTTSYPSKHSSQLYVPATLTFETLFECVPRHRKVNGYQWRFKVKVSDPI
jgi:hypothetical protein